MAKNAPSENQLINAEMGIMEMRAKLACVFSDAHEGGDKGAHDRFETLIDMCDKVHHQFHDLIDYLQGEKAGDDAD